MLARRGMLVGITLMSISRRNLSAVEHCVAITKRFVFNLRLEPADRTSAETHRGFEMR